MDRIVSYYDVYLNKNIDHVFTSLRTSNYHPSVYYMVEFVRLSPQGEESAVDKEFNIGQNADGYHGYYRAYIFIPSYWKFSSFTTKDIPKIIEIYGDKIIYKKVDGPEGTSISKHNCIGWAYDYGLDDESLIGKGDVAVDIAHVIKDIIDWEWDNEPEMMARTYINDVYESMNHLLHGTKKDLPEDVKYLIDNLYDDMKNIIRREEQ